MPAGDADVIENDIAAGSAADDKGWEVQGVVPDLA